MREIMVQCGDVIPLGRAGENQALAVLFDVTGWEESFGSGTFTMAVQRPGEALAYQRDVTREGDQVRWIVSDVDTGIAGTGEVQLRYSVGDAVAKSAVYQTVISPSVGDIGPAPDPYEDVLEEIQGFAEDAAASATAAETSRGQAEQRATEAAGSATQAAGSATAAAASAAAAQTAAERDVPAATTAWLEAHVDPETGYVLDSSLSIQGAAADAAAVGHFRDAMQIATNLSNVVIGQGNISSTGLFVNNSARCRTANIVIPPGYVNISIADGYKFIPRCFDNPNAGSSHYVGSPSDNQWVTTCQVDRSYAPYLRIVIAYADDTIAITPGDCAGKLTILGYSYTDTTLSEVGKAADAATVGQYINRGLMYRSVLASSADLNDIIQPGVYVWSESAATGHRPEKSTSTMIVFGSTQNFGQLVFAHKSGKIYRRSNFQGVWSDWASDTLDGEDLYRDQPENEGVANVVRRAYQVQLLTSTAESTMPWFNTTVKEPGTVLIGVPYSSPRPERLYVPQCVSFDSFATAIKNPNSYLYTRRQNIPNYKGHTYMGAVCSSFVSWCYGILDTIPTTASIPTYPGFYEIADQDVGHIKLGDALNNAGKHIIIVTDILRDRFGQPAYLELTEQVATSGAHTIATKYTAREVTAMLSRYTIMRYEYIATVPYTPSPWVHVTASEIEEPVWNNVIIPRRGDKANWHKGEDVEIDVLGAGTYTGYTLDDLDGGTTTGTYTGTVITLSGLAAGRYRLKLNGSTDSDWTYFDVIDTQGTSYQVQSGRKIKVTPYTSLGTPSSVNWYVNNPADEDNLAPVAFHIFTAEEIAQGYAVVDAPPQSSRQAPGDVWLMSCAYNTEYGLYSGQLTAVNASTTGTTTESAYTRSAYIEEFPS